jgi:hypothetical protein
MGSIKRDNGMNTKVDRCFPNFINWELRIKEHSDALVVVLSQKKSFAFYKTQFAESVLHIADQQDTYFTLGAEETASAVIAVATDIGAFNILFCGCSKGGFGALLMASLCSSMDGLRKYSSLCFGPQTKIHPENPRVQFPSYKSLLRKAQQDGSIANALAKHGNVTNVPAGARAVLIYGDQNVNDRAEAEDVSGSNVSLIPMPLKTHSVVLPFLVDNKDAAAVTAIVESLTQAAQRQADLKTTMRSSATIKEILSLPRTKSLPKLCTEMLSGVKKLQVFEGQ